MTITLTIDGQKIEAEKGATILEVAREHGIEIPSLCFHEGLQPYGACRLCVVELAGLRGSKLVSSCSYPAEDGAVVKTNSPMVRETRKMIVELLLADCPDVKVVQDLAHEFGIERPRFELEDNDCILCGLCVRACKEIVGVSAISLVNRGVDKRVKTPFEIASRDCIGCSTCVLVCPTGAIKLEDIGEPKLVHHWASDFEVMQCRICGDHYLSPKPITDYERLFAEET